MILSQSFQDELTSLLDQLVNLEKFSGVVLINHKSGIYQYSGGLANRTWMIPNQLKTRFRVASISKMFTAVAILQLIEQNLCSLETPIHSILDLKNSTLDSEINILHLLTMTSGITDWFDESGDWEAKWQELCERYPIYQFRSNEDYLPLFIHLPAETAPGKIHKYNGAGYILLGLIIQALSGENYYNYIHKHIFQPAGMVHSDYTHIDAISPDIATGYMPASTGIDSRDKWQKNIYSITPRGAADGGAVSTATDLVRFFQAIHSEKLLNSHYTQQFLTPQVASNPKPFRGFDWYYGYGITFITDNTKNIVRYGHTGEEDGVSCRLYHYPQMKLDLAILSNQSWCAGQIGWEIHDLITQFGG